MTLPLHTTISSMEYGTVGPNRNNREEWVFIPGQNAELLDLAGQPVLVTCQPPADCYFAIEMRALIDSGALTGGYLETYLMVTPADADGRASCVANLPIGANLTVYTQYISAIFRLRAGTFYTFYVRFTGAYSPNQIRYYGGAAYTELTGHVVGY